MTYGNSDPLVTFAVVALVAAIVLYERFREAESDATTLKGLRTLYAAGEISDPMSNRHHTVLVIDEQYDVAPFSWLQEIDGVGLREDRRLHQKVGLGVDVGCEGFPAGGLELLEVEVLAIGPVQPVDVHRRWRQRIRRCPYSDDVSSEDFGPSPLSCLNTLGSIRRLA